MKSFPSRTYVQEFDGRLGPESKLVADEMNSRGVPVVNFTAEQVAFRGLASSFKPTDLIVGDFECTRRAMKTLKIPIPEPPDYPECLKKMLHRRIWSTTLGKVGEEIEGSSAKPIFVKPSTHTKLFSGLILTTDWLGYLLSEYKANEPIYCSEVVKFLSEYRVYCVKGEIRACCHYAGDKSLALDLDVAKEAVELFSKHGYEGRFLDGYGIDFGILKKEIEGKEVFVTALIEVNDGISLGSYDGITKKDYTDMLAARWEQLVNSREK